MSASCIYEGTIRHRRFDPRREFSHRLALAYLDLDELPELLDGRLVARRPGLVRFRRRDYLGDPAVPLDRAVRDLVQDQTGARPTGPIRLLTQLRSFGHCFNPVSFYYCLDAGGEQRAGARRGGDEHAVGRAARLRASKARSVDSAVLAGQFDKALHVSPFMGMDHRYHARAATARPDAVGPHRLEPRAGATAFDATLALRRRAADAGLDGADHRPLPARDRPRAGADLRPCARAEARGRARPPPPADGTRHERLALPAGSCRSCCGGSRSAACSS